MFNRPTVAVKNHLRRAVGLHEVSI